MANATSAPSFITNHSEDDLSSANDLDGQDIFFGFVLPIISCFIVVLFFAFVLFMWRNYRNQKQIYDESMVSDLISPDDIVVVIDRKADEIVVEIPNAVMSVVVPESTQAQPAPDQQRSESVDSGPDVVMEEEDNTSIDEEESQGPERGENTANFFG